MEPVKLMELFRATALDRVSRASGSGTAILYWIRMGSFSKLSTKHKHCVFFLNHLFSIFWLDIFSAITVDVSWVLLNHSRCKFRLWKNWKHFSKKNLENNRVWDQLFFQIFIRKKFSFFQRRNLQREWFSNTQDTSTVIAKKNRVKILKTNDFKKIHNVYALPWIWK